MKPIVILYHTNCPDGFGAAWAAWKKFGIRAEYVGVNPETLPNKSPVGKEIYVVDVSYPIAVQKKLRRKNKKLVILDHHASNKRDTEFFPENVFDNEHSGSVLAWNYFHPGRKIPLFLRYVEDNDIWRFRLPHARELSPVVFLLDFDFKDWSRFIRRFEDKNGRKEIFKQGRIILGYEGKIIKSVVERATLVKFEGYKTLAANSAILESEIGHLLTKKLPPLGIVWRQRKDQITVSLRSNGKIDVSKLAKKYGGGGHRKASGFGFKAGGKFPWKIIKD